MLQEREWPGIGFFCILFLRAHQRGHPEAGLDFAKVMRTVAQFLLGLPGINEEEIKGFFEKFGLLNRYDEIEKILKNARPEP